MLNTLVAVFVTAAALSMAFAGAAMVYDTTLPYPGLGEKVARLVMFLWLWPVAAVTLVVLTYGLGSLWIWAL